MSLTLLLGILFQLTVFILDLGAGISCWGNRSIILLSFSGGGENAGPLCITWLGGGGGGIAGGAGAGGGGGGGPWGNGGGGGGGPPSPMV